MINQPFINSRHLSQEDSIGRLNLSIRSFNALSSSGVNTVGEVVTLVESDRIRTIKGLGTKCILEVKARIAEVNINDLSEVDMNKAIGTLNLSLRSLNALTRSGIETVEDVIRLIESGKISSIRGLGTKCIIEIKESVENIEIGNTISRETKTPPTETQTMIDVIPDRVLKWLSRLISKQVSAELLHEQAVIVNQTVTNWLTGYEEIENDIVYEVFTSILDSSLNICDEIEYLLNQFSGKSYLSVLLFRYGYERKSLNQN